MTNSEIIESAVVQKFRLLPLGKKKEVLDFVEFLQLRSEELNEDEWRDFVAAGLAEELADEREDIYSLTDGKPLNVAG